MAVEPAEPLGAAAAAAMTLCGHRPMTLVLGHVWITIWRPYRTRSPADFLAALPVNGIQPGNRGGPPGSSPATSHAPHRHPAYFHSSPATLVHRPYTRHLAGAGVIGACSHAGPGSQAALRLPPRCAILTIWTTPTSSSGCWPYRHTQEASSGIHAWPDQCLARLRVHGRGPTRCQVLNFLTRSSSQRALQRRHARDPGLNAPVML